MLACNSGAILVLHANKDASPCRCWFVIGLSEFELARDTLSQTRFNLVISMSVTVRLPLQVADDVT